MLDVNEFSKLTTSLFSASIGQITWDDFLADLSQKSGGICTHIFGYDTEAGFTLEMAESGYDPDFIDSYHDHFSPLNAWAPGFSTKAEGIVVDCEDMCRTEDLVKTEFYHDWLRPQEEIIQGGGALIFKNESRVFALGGNIREKDSENLKAPWLSLVGQLVPHVQQAFEISRALAGAKLETAIVASEGLRKIPGIVILTEFGRIIFANDVAQRMLARGEPIRSGQGEMLRFQDPTGHMNPAEDTAGRLLSLSPPSMTREILGASGVTYQLRFAKLDPSAQIAMPLHMTLGFSGRCTLLIVTEKTQRVSPSQKLRETYGLTGAEAEITLLITEGHTNKDIAEMRRVSLHTVRSQLKSAMSKMEVHRQMDLARLVQNLSQPDMENLLSPPH